ncbi:MAG TPA: hypothetical protein VJS13_01375 [Pyrinomonadaceae bacterium]|nr:hypothetical protein [Pyrinomonadaceae bacterium]
MTVKKQLLHLLSAVAILIGALAASAYAHSSAAHVHKNPGLTRPGSEKMVVYLNEHAGVTTIVTQKISAVREKTTSRTETVKAALAPMPAFDEPAIEGGGCVRDGCACDAATHGNPWCYSTSRGDCPNHQGLLCVWSE